MVTALELFIRLKSVNQPKHGKSVKYPIGKSAKYPIGKSANYPNYSHGYSNLRRGRPVDPFFEERCRRAHACATTKAQRTGSSLYYSDTHIIIMDPNR